MTNEKFDVSNRVFTVLMVLLAGLVIYWGTSVYSMWVSGMGNFPREISVEGKGSAYVVADVAETRLGIYIEGKTAEEVTKEGAEKMKAIIEAIKKEGVDEKDIKTSNYNLSPKYNWSQEKGSYTDGFYLDQSLQVKVRDFEIVGKVLSSATTAGANSNSGVSFVVDDREIAKEEARKEAIAQAKEKAEQIAQASGLKLGKLLGYYEYDDNYGVYPVAHSAEYAYGAGEKAVMDSAVPAIEPGQEEIKINVSLTYRVK